MNTIRNHHRRWRTIVMPTEHGSWGFITEPLVLGLLLAPGLRSLVLSIAILAAFFLRQPLKLYWKDQHAGRRVPRTASARYFAILFASAMIIAGLFSLVWMPSWLIVVPLVLAAPLILLQFSYDVRGKSRAMSAQLCGVVATGAFAASLVLMQGWSWQVAFGLWLALAIKGVTAVLYVRSRLRLERNLPINRIRVWVVHFIGFLLLFAVALVPILPWTALLAMAILGIRSGIGLSELRQPRPPKVIGMQEMVYGFVFILLIVLGYWFNLFV